MRMKEILPEGTEWAKKLMEADSRMDYSNLHNRWFAYARFIIAKYCLNLSRENPKEILKDWEGEEFDKNVAFDFEDDHPTNIGALLNFVDEAGKEINYDFSDLKEIIKIYATHYGYEIKFPPTEEERAQEMRKQTKKMLELRKKMKSSDKKIRDRASEELLSLLGVT